MKPLFIYNLFPKLYKDISEWIKSLDKITEMGFNTIFINPFHYPGFSGSLYAVKDYYAYNENFFVKGKPPEEQMKNFINECKKRNLDILMDLVVNHSSIDSILINEHKNWYKLTELGEIEKPGTWENGQWITWGDLATFDLDNSSDKEGLWNYLLNVCRHYLKMGFTGFRCDAAYQVSSDFWTFLISHIKNEFTGVIFLAETLGCTPVQIQALSKCGFDYIFNSSKWWNFNEPWCLEQYDLTRNIAPSISFPETHDTTRLLDEANDNEILFLQRLYFAGVFSKGFMITTGFEYGFKKKLSPVSTTPKDWEITNKNYTKNIKELLTVKKSLSPLHEESKIEIINHTNWINVFCFIKEWENQRVLICLNKDLINKQKVSINDVEFLLKTESIKDFSPMKNIKGYIKNLDLELLPGEIKIFTSEKYYK